MSHPAKKVFFGSFVALCLLGSAWGQSTISFTNSATSTAGNFVNLSLGKFDSNLGELTGVVVTITFVSVSGSVDISNDTGSGTTISSITTQAQFTNTALWSANRTLNATNSFSPAVPSVLDDGDSQSYTLSPSPVTNTFNFSTNISSGFWAAYSSVGGSGSNVFGFRTRLIPVADGPVPTFTQGANLSSTAQMTVTYTYTGAEPIPEPSTVAAGAFLTVLAAASYWRRRRNAR